MRLARVLIAVAMLGPLLAAGGCADRSGGRAASFPPPEEPLPDGIVPLAREMENPTP